MDKPNVSKTEEPESKLGGKPGETPREENTNDPIWYLQTPELAIDANAITFSWAVGDKIPFIQKSDFADQIPSGVDVKFADGMGGFRQSGICSLFTVPTIGAADSATDPINIAASSLYAFMRKQMSGRKNYDPADLMMYLLTGSDLVSFHAFMCRLYKLATLYSTRNKYYARELIIENGVDPDDLLSNLADFRAFINVYAQRISVFKLPSVITLIHRKAMIYHDVYTEGLNVKDQMYQFVPCGFLKFDYYKNSNDPTDPLNGSGMLSFNYWWQPHANNPRKTVAQIMAYANNLLTNITLDEDFSLMCGDIVKVFGESGIIPLELLTAESTLTLVRDDLVLSQFQNAHIIDDAYVGGGSSTPGVNVDKYDITQTTDGSIKSWATYGVPGNLGWNQYLDQACNRSFQLANRLITSENDIPGIPELVESTRFVPGLFKDKKLGNDYLIASGTELAVGMRIDAFADYSDADESLHVSRSGTWIYPVVEYISYMNNASINPVNSSDLLYPMAGSHYDPSRFNNALMLVSGFKHVPKICMFGFFANGSSGTAFATGATVHRINLKWEYANVASIDLEHVAMMQRAAIISLTHVQVAPDYI